jgi:FixJ family two-component response regulator
MEMVTDGRSNKEIASSLGVSAKTIEAHRARVMEKMQAGSLAELVRMALVANERT